LKKVGKIMRMTNVCHKKMLDKISQREHIMSEIKEGFAAILMMTMLVGLLGVETWIEYLL